MLFENLMDIFFSFYAWLISLLPTMTDLPGWADNATTILRYGLMFFPADVFAVAIGSIVFWMLGHLVWAIVEWVYKKIPGVD